ncbi:MAG: TPM domain-containing protein, partial [Bacteroidota bacterium]
FHFLKMDNTKDENGVLIYVAVNDRKFVIYGDHFHLPLTYSFSINLLQGVSISLANNKMPIARKLLLERVDKKPDRKKYDDLETTFFKGRESPKSDIVNYLLSVPNVIDYMNIPYPAYDTSDLIKETKVRELNKQ